MFTLRKRQLIFFVLYATCLLSLLILGQAYINYVLIACFSATQLVFIRYIDWSQLSKYRFIILAWFLFLGSAVLSLTQTINVPLSLQQVVFYGLAFQTFFFFLLTSENFVSSEICIFLLQVVGLITVGLSAIISIFPSLLVMLTDMNLLNTVYGHNHIAALLIILIPFGWWLLSNKRIPITLSLVAILIPTVYVSFTFARVDMVIALCENLFLFAFTKKDSRWRSFERTSMVVGTTLLLLALGLVVGISLYSTQKGVCVLPPLHDQLCKPIQKNARIVYWKQAFDVTKRYPFFGSGPGTFQLSSKPFLPMPQFKSAYAHNAFLQAFAELGILGGAAFCFLMISLLIKAAVVIQDDLKKRQYTLKLAGFVAIICLYVNAFFDFDWDFLALFLITFILLALILKEDSKQYLHSLSQTTQRIFRVLYISTGIALVAVGITFIVIDSLTKLNRVATAFQLFPYFHWHRMIFEKSDQLTDTQKSALQDIYKYHYSYYFDLLFTEGIKVSDPYAQANAMQQLVTLDPWTIQHIDLVHAWSVLHEDKKVEQALSDTVAFFRAKQHSYVDTLYVTSNQRKTTIATQLITAGNSKYAQGDAQKAAQLYKDAIFFDESILLTPEAIPSINNTDDPVKLAQFLTFTQGVNPSHFGSHANGYAEAFMMIYESNLKKSLQHSDTLQPATNIVYYILGISELKAEKIWDETVEEIHPFFEKTLAGHDIQTAYKYLEFLEGVRADIISFPYQIRHNDDDLDHKITLQLQDYTIKVIDSSLSENRLDIFLKAHYLLKRVSPGVPSHVNTVFLGKLFTLSSDNITQLNEIITVPPSEKIDTIEIPVAEQYLATLINAKDWSKAEKQMLSMKERYNNYWITAQVGYFYTLKGDKETALRAFSDCLATYGTHDDCAWGKSSLEPPHGEGDAGRFWQIRDILLGKGKEQAW